MLLLEISEVMMVQATTPAVGNLTLQEASTLMATVMKTKTRSKMQMQRPRRRPSGPLNRDLMVKVRIMITTMKKTLIRIWRTMKMEHNTQT